MRKLTPEEKEKSAERAKEYRRQWVKDNRERCNENMRRWRKANPEKTKVSKRRANLKLWYGVTPEWHAATLASQGNCCAICKVVDPSKRGGWHVDHNHATGKVRGVLCGHCNRAIGLLNDLPEVCVSASDYLKEHADNVS